MTDPDTILTKNVTGASGTRIKRELYDAFREAMIDIIAADDEGVLFKDLPALVEPAIDPAMLPKSGSCAWYVTTVKLDLEARGEIERVPGSKPQRLRIPHP